MEKQLVVITGPSWNPAKHTVVLNGVLAEERLTPAMARRAVYVAVKASYPATVWDNGLGYGYRLYRHSHRKIKSQ